MTSYSGTYSSNGLVFVTGAPDEVPEVGEHAECDVERSNGSVDEGVRVRCFKVQQARYRNRQAIKPSPDWLVACCEQVVTRRKSSGLSKVTWKGSVRRTRLKKFDGESGVELTGKSVPEVGDVEVVMVPSGVDGFVVKQVEVVHTMESVQKRGQMVAYARYPKERAR